VVLEEPSEDKTSVALKKKNNMTFNEIGGSRSPNNKWSALQEMRLCEGEVLDETPHNV